MRAWLSGVVGGGRGGNSLIYTGPEGKPGGVSRFPLSLKTDGVLKIQSYPKKRKKKVLGPTRGTVCFLKGGWTGWEREAVTPIRQGQSGSGGANNYSDWGAAACDCANPVQMTKDISIYGMSWLSKRHSVYARGARAAWTECQWWVEMTKEEKSRRVGARGGRRWGRSDQG